MKSVFVYYDEDTLSVVAVSPISQDEFSHLGVRTFPFEEGLPFISGELDPSSFFVIDTNDGCVLSDTPLDKPPVDGDEVRNITKTDVGTEVVGINATLFLGSSVIEFTIPKNLVGKKLKRDVLGGLTFFLTKRGDPEMVIEEIVVETRKLLVTGSVQVKLSDLGKSNDFWLLTKPDFEKYSFSIVPGMWFSPKNTGGMKTNNLVSFRNVKTLTKGLPCVLATFNKKTRTLEVGIRNGATISSVCGLETVLFVTKPGDPTVILHHFDIDLRKLNDGLVLSIPTEVGDVFGLGSVPIAENLFLKLK